MKHLYQFNDIIDNILQHHEGCQMCVITKRFCPGGFCPAIIPTQNKVNETTVELIIRSDLLPRLIILY